MRFFLRSDGWRPWVVLAFATGALLVDVVAVVRPVMGYFEESSIWPRDVVARSFAAYALFATVVDLAVWRFGPTRSRHPSIRLAVVCVAAAGVAVLANEWRSLPIVAGVLIFGAVALGRFTWPLAIAATGVALWPLFARPASPEPPAFAASPAPRPPDLVLVVLDTVRRERTSAYGHGRRDTTPNLRALAERGVRFDRAYATGSWSLPSHASLFTGLTTERHGAHDAHAFLDEGHPTLAALLVERGYETVGFTGNPWLGHGTGMARGFHVMHEPWRTSHMKWFLAAYRAYNGLFAPSRDKGGAETLEGLERWLASRDPSRPYFLFVNLMEPHAPYTDVPRAMRRRFTHRDLSWRELERAGLRTWETAQNGKPLAPEDEPLLLDLYDGSIAAGDAYLGEILTRIGDDAIVAVVSDHGEFTGEHTLYGHPGTLYEQNLRVPFVMAGPSLPRGRRVEGLVSLADVMPTFLGLAGVEPPPGLDGVDLRRVIGEGVPADRTITAEQFSERGGQRSAWQWNRPDVWSVVDGNSQAVLRGTRKRIVVEDGTDLTFDLARDPHEERPLVGAGTDLVARVPAAPEGDGAPELGAAESSALEALGYLRNR